MIFLSKMMKKIKPDMYKAGFHFIGVGHHFIKFPKTV